MEKSIETALVSVFNKAGLEKIIIQLHKLGIRLYSTGGTKDFIESLKIPVHTVESITQFPSILGGRVKTLHPNIFGGILARREKKEDQKELEKHQIPTFDLVIVDLYPFEDTLKNTDNENEIIEKIDIGGVSLIRAAAKNYHDVWVVSHRDQYEDVFNLLVSQKGKTTLADRKYFACAAFDISSHYDTAIFNYFNKDKALPSLKISKREVSPLRYGENPHQKGWLYGTLSNDLEQIHGKELSYNNLLDIDAAVQLIEEFDQSEHVFAILKHNNACGVAKANSVKEAYLRALEADPTSAFGGILICNQSIDKESALEMHQLFFEVIIAPDYHQDAFDILKKKKNRRILLKKKNISAKNEPQLKTVLNHLLVQDKDIAIENEQHLSFPTDEQPDPDQIQDLIMANKIVKHTKSNAIVLLKNGRMLASGVGQTSRVDALQQAIEKAKKFKLDLAGSVMASDAFFPFPDCVEIAHKEGVTSIIQPGGSVNDQASISYCNQNGMSMAFTGIRHFKH